MVAALVGATLMAGLTSVTLVSRAGDDVSLSASEAAAVRWLERVGDPPPVPPPAVAPASPAGTGDAAAVVAPPPPPGAGPGAAPAAGAPRVDPAADPVAVPAGAPTASAPAPAPASPSPAPAVPGPPPTRPVLALPTIDLAPLLPGGAASAAAAAKMAPGRSQTGVASWFDAPAGTCAHLTLPFGTVVRVTRMHTGAVATCRVDDRGPTLETGRVIDLSADTFAKLASTDAGLIDVRIEW